jgi:release factor glutamine methyltransferase
LIDNSKTIRSFLEVTTDFFKQKGIPTPRLDAEVLLGYVLGMSRIQLYVNYDQPLQESEVDRYREVVRKRAKRIPVAYIVGSKEFMSLDLFVGTGALIPRPDTEILVEAILGRFPKEQSFAMADIGTGSGAIAVAVAVNRPEAAVYGVDISSEALSWAAKNVARFSLEERITLVKGDMLAPLTGLGLQGKLDLIASNPPYIPSGDIDGLQPEVAVYEPRNALDGGPGGLDFYRILISGCREFLKPGGALAFEIGKDQAKDISGLASRLIPGAKIQVVQDYAGFDRVVMLDLP